MMQAVTEQNDTGADSVRNILNGMLPKEEPGVEYYFRKILDKKHYLDRKMSAGWILDQIDLRVSIYNEEMELIKPLYKVHSPGKMPVIEDKAKLKAITRYAEIIAPEVEQAEKEVLIKAEEERVAAEAKKARERKELEGRWARWDVLDYERTAAFEELEAAHTKAVNAARSAWIEWPGVDGSLSKEYSLIPGNLKGIGDQAKQQGKDLRALRDQIIN